MDFDEYQKGTGETAIYPGQNTLIGLTYAALGLSGEGGEVANQVKKVWRDEEVDLQREMKTIIDGIERDLKSGNISYDSLLSSARMSLEYIFNSENAMGEERKAKIVDELGDTLWYAARVASELGLSLGDVAEQNLDKLAARRLKDKLHGDGDDR